MKRNRVVMIIAVMMCVVLVGAAGVQAGAPSAPYSPSAVVGTAFTYQGQIDRNGTLFTGTCDLQFSLWDDAAAGTQQGATLSVNAVNVDNGVFTAELDFGNQFTGAARWLETAAMCADDVDFTTLPRVALNPALYAVSLIPGAQIEGSISAAANHANNNPQSPNTPSGIINARNLGTGPAVVGTSGANAGVWGSSVDDSGVYGESTNWHGVTGVSLNQVGVAGSSTNFIGVWGDTAADNNTGVVGLAWDPCPAGSPALCYQIHPRNSAGVTGHALAKGAGVLGQSAEGNGVYGEAQTDGYGVLGRSATGVSVAGFSTNYDKPDLDSSGFGTPAAMFGGPNGVIGYSKANGGNGVSGVALTSGSVGVAGYGYDTGNGVGYAGYFHGKTATTILEIQGGADLAELFNVGPDKAEPGTLMVIDAANPGHLAISRSAYDTKVAGIVSGAGDVKPGLTLQQEGVLDGDTQVAIAGRVYVNATSSNGPIAPGDLLTTSDVPGYAMKATDHDRAQGAIIGKAMTGLKDGTGLVLVLVNLQ